MLTKTIRVFDDGSYAPPKSLLSYRKFRHRGWDVEEFVVYVSKECAKLIWVREPFSALKVHGIDNEICHTVFPISLGRLPDDQTYIEMARNRVQDVFDGHHLQQENDSIIPIPKPPLIDSVTTIS